MIKNFSWVFFLLFFNFQEAFSRQKAEDLDYIFEGPELLFKAFCKSQNIIIRQNKLIPDLKEAFLTKDSCNFFLKIRSYLKLEQELEQDMLYASTIFEDSPLNFVLETFLYFKIYIEREKFNLKIPISYSDYVIAPNIYRRFEVASEGKAVKFYVDLTLQLFSQHPDFSSLLLKKSEKENYNQFPLEEQIIFALKNLNKFINLKSVLLKTKDDSLEALCINEALKEGFFYRALRSIFGFNCFSYI